MGFFLHSYVSHFCKRLNLAQNEKLYKNVKLLFFTEINQRVFFGSRPTDRGCDKYQPLVSQQTTIKGFGEPSKILLLTSFEHIQGKYFKPKAFIFKLVVIAKPYHDVAMSLLF